MIKDVKKSADKRLAAQLMKRFLLVFRALLDEELKLQGVTAMQALIQKSEKDGWIERHKDKGNDRVLAASLTEAGEELLRTAEVAVKKIEKTLWSGVSD